MKRAPQAVVICTSLYLPDDGDRTVSATAPLPSPLQRYQTVGIIRERDWSEGVGVERNERSN